jgi:hypothetical protein
MTAELIKCALYVIGEVREPVRECLSIDRPPRSSWLSDPFQLAQDHKDIPVLYRRLLAADRLAKDGKRFILIDGHGHISVARGVRCPLSERRHRFATQVIEKLDGRIVFLSNLFSSTLIGATLCSLRPGNCSGLGVSLTLKGATFCFSLAALGVPSNPHAEEDRQYRPDRLNHGGGRRYPSRLCLLLGDLQLQLRQLRWI